MHTSIQNTMLFLLIASTSIVASPVPSITELNTSQPTAANGTAGTAGTTPFCSPQVKALVDGINANIADQRNEQAAVTVMGYVLQESPIDTTIFDAAKASLLTYVQKGITIRQNNQQITPPGNAATEGLATVAAAQQEELNLSNSLSASDVKGSTATVEKLKTDFAGGIAKNQENVAAAAKGCKVNA
ncbi:hypothetical protein DSL72_006771 [Monilinia vaccinii-corymbosi]|uniref:Uncharacterized protein n=1 Tax=Monilinia vaccinii-corymbosi TaxID=61207 RepID=A0A8A3PN99_9HELO|nr:hypothetical protein DSL72_006771 [Monilinia vaccinii-corymbosi]